MKKIVLFILCLFVTSFFFANDAYYFMVGGQLVPTQESDTQIEMQEEVINIILEKKYYEITVDFTFFNHGETEELEVGFPFFCVGIGDGEISDFKCWTDDIETSYKDFPIKKEWRETTQLENAYIRSIIFPSKKITKTRIYYKSTYGREAPSYFMAKYLYGTGSTWKNSIGKITVRITNNNLYYAPRWTTFPEGGSIKRTGANSWEGIYTNVEPENYTDCITLRCGNIFGDDGPRVLSKERFLGYYKKNSEKDVFFYTKAQLRLLRNAIYAFNGYPFKSQDLIDCFEKDCVKNGWYGWDSEKDDYRQYQIDNSFTENKLTENEKYNVYFLLELEKSIK